MQIDLTDKTALVCGSTQGIGRAIAEVFAKAGAQVVLVARNAEKLQQTLKELPRPNHQKHQFLVADFSKPEALLTVLSNFVSEQPNIDILVNNTGGPPAGPVAEATIEAFDAAFAQHLKCNHILMQTLTPGMKQRNFGRIINIISTSVKQPLDGLGVSNTIRGAVANWSKTLANELGPYGITVNNILPGATATERLQSIVANKAQKTARPKTAIEKAMLDAIPAKRFAAPEEIAAAACFLASEYAAYINGINLPVDGGRTKSL
ncbi:MAG: SDR family oxidoreductase [Flavobacteriaceae bacterium]|nr:SDR family oxidoreductase [Flavobacteriaceae bacterium]